MRAEMKRGEGSLIVSDGSSERILTTRKLPDAFFELWGNTVAWSPDGQRIACVEWLKQNNNLVAGVLVVDEADGQGTRLPNPGKNWNYLYDLTWLPGGDGLLVVAREDSSSTYQIWRVSYPEGEWRKVTNDLNDYAKLSVSADGSRIVTVQKNEFTNLWLLPQGDLRRARQLTFGNGRTDGRSGLSWTPNGRVVFASNASGSSQIWIADADGANLKHLTYGSEASSEPFVSPDGRHVVFRSDSGKKSHIWRMDIDGSNLVRLSDGSGEVWPAVTPDGREVTYTSWTSPFSTILSIPLAGGAPPRQLTDKYPAANANTSLDGKLLAVSFYDPEVPSPWRLGILPVGGGPPVNSFDEPYRGLPRWTPDSQAVMYMSNTNAAIWKQSIHGGAPVRILSLMPRERIYNFAFSPDNTQLMIARGRPQSDVLLMEDIR